MPEGAVGAQPEAGEASAGADLALTGTQNWAARSHRELYDSVHVGNDPGRVGELAHEWTRLGREISGAAQWMSERVRATEAGWRGEAATAARAALRRLADWSWATGDAAVALGGRVAQQGQIMEQARATMPEPVRADLESDLARKYTTGGLAGMLAAGVDVKAEHDRASAAHARAVAVMTRMDAESRAVDASTLRFVAPPNPVHGVTGQLAQSRPASETHIPTITRSAAVDRPSNTLPARDDGARGSGGSAGRPVEVQPLFAEARNAEIGVLPASSPSPSSDARTETDKIARDRQEPSKHGGDATAHEIAAGRRPSVRRGADMPAREVGPRGRQGAARGEDLTSALHNPQGDTTSQSATNGRDLSTGVPTPVADHSGHQSSPQLPWGAAAGGNAGVRSTPPTTRSWGGSRRSAYGGHESFPSQPGSVGEPWTTRSGPGPAKGGVGGEEVAKLPGPSGLANSAFRIGPNSGAGRGVTSGSVPNAAPGSGVASGGAADGDSHKDPGSDGSGAASADAGLGAVPGPGMNGMGGMGMAGMGSGGQAAQDQERSSKYREGEPIAEVPGADLPPAVLGAVKKKPKAQEGP